MQNIIIIACVFFGILNFTFLIVSCYLSFCKKKSKSGTCVLSFAFLFSAIIKGLQGEFTLMIGIGILSVLCFATYLLYPEH